LPAAQRRLAAIMYTDMVGYTALGQRNESLSLALVEEQRKMVRPILARHGGREIKTMGDAFLVEFPSAVDAVRCAYDIQRAAREFNLSLAADKRVHLRIGIHLGEVVEDQDDILGDAVNVASRIEKLAEEGGVSVTSHVYDQVQSKLDLQFASLGHQALKGVDKPVEVYKVVMPWRGIDVAPAPRFPSNRIAVLPFTSFSVDPNDAFFADGITEEIISAVSGISGLDIISRTSVMGYKGTTKKVEEIGRELKVGTVLEGSFRKAGNRIRVATQLIDVAGDRHLWAQNYDRDLGDVFAVQSDVARQVAEALRVRILSPELERIEKKPTEDVKAYTVYLRGKYLMNRRGLDDLRKAREYFEQAVEDDPRFALAYVGVADCCLLIRNNWLIDREANLEKARAHLTKALELDPDSSEVHATTGLLHLNEYEFRKAEEELRRSTALKPSYAPAHLWYSNVLGCYASRSADAFKEIEKALELDPLSPIINLNYGGYCASSGDYDRALEFFRQAAELGLAFGRGAMADTYGRMKMFDDMKRESAIYVEQVRSTFPMVGVAADALSAYHEDDKEALRRILPEVEAHLQETSINATFLPPLYFRLGDLDKGFEWLERAYDEKSLIFASLVQDREFDSVRKDPRYVALLKRVNLI
jgi:adenylate cyclase